MSEKKDIKKLQEEKNSDKIINWLTKRVKLLNELIKLGKNIYRIILLLLYVISAFVGLYVANKFYLVWFLVKPFIIRYAIWLIITIFSWMSFFEVPWPVPFFWC